MEEPTAVEDLPAAEKPAAAERPVRRRAATPESTAAMQAVSEESAPEPEAAATAPQDEAVPEAQSAEISPPPAAPSGVAASVADAAMPKDVGWDVASGGAAVSGPPKGPDTPPAPAANPPEDEQGRIRALELRLASLEGRNELLERENERLWAFVREERQALTRDVSRVFAAQETIVHRVVSESFRRGAASARNNGADADVDPEQPMST